MLETTLNSIQNRLRKPTLRDLKAQAVFGKKKIKQVGMQVYIARLGFSKVAWFTCFKSRVEDFEVVDETPSCCVIELLDRKRVKEVFSYIEGIDISAVSIDTVHTSVLSPKCLYRS